MRQLCPDAVLHHRGVLSSFGDGDDVSVIAAVERAYNEIEDLDIVVMSFGAPSADDQPPPMAYTIQRLLAGSLVIASAGNDASNRPSYPAALPNVVAVGGLDGNGRAGFSNYGPWVDACAPALNVLSTFFMDFDDIVDSTHQRDQKFSGWATWSGTSFAGPKVAGVVAQDMYLRQCSATESWRRLSSWHHFRMPDLGVVFNV